MLRVTIVGWRRGVILPIVVVMMRMGRGRGRCTTVVWISVAVALIVRIVGIVYTRGVRLPRLRVVVLIVSMVFGRSMVVAVGMMTAARVHAARVHS